MWIDQGRVHRDGQTARVVSEYESSANALDATGEGARQEGGPTQFIGWWLREGDLERSHEVRSLWERVTVTFLLNVKKPLVSAHMGIGLYDSAGTLVWGFGEDGIELGSGVHELDFSLPSMPLKPGHYRVQVSIWEYSKMLDLWDGVPELLVATDPVTHWIDHFAGVMNIPAEFETRPADGEPR